MYKTYANKVIENLSLFRININLTLILGSVESKIADLIIVLASSMADFDFPSQATTTKCTVGSLMIISLPVKLLFSSSISSTRLSIDSSWSNERKTNNENTKETNRTPNRRLD